VDYRRRGGAICRRIPREALPRPRLYLHDRRIPGSRANIDHIAVAPSGVWVIDTKRSKGKIAVHRPLSGKAKLTINGRDKSASIDVLDEQVAVVRAVVNELAPDVAVHGALCIVGDLPLLGTLSFRGYPLLSRKALARRLNARAPLDGGQCRTLADALARQLPCA
jgi:hypothetical protein